MNIYDELVARGLIAQVTDEAEIKELVNTGRATFYIGFDPTADSLHVGHFMALSLMKRLQMAGNKPIVLLGGATALIGDPSGRTDMRTMMTQETIRHNIECFKKQMARFIEFGEDKAMMVNNADWLSKLNYIEMLRDVGTHFSVNHMLRADQLLKLLSEKFDGLIFTNLVDFDQQYGHRNDAAGYAAALEDFDRRVPEIIDALQPEDVLMIMADHGCDPTTTSTDHSREYVPLLVTGQSIKSGVDLGIRASFSDVAATVARLFGLTFNVGEEFASAIMR